MVSLCFSLLLFIDVPSQAPHSKLWSTQLLRRRQELPATLRGELMGVAWASEICGSPRGYCFCLLENHIFGVGSANYLQNRLQVSLFDTYSVPRLDWYSRLIRLCSCLFRKHCFFRTPVPPWASGPRAFDPELRLRCVTFSKLETFSESLGVLRCAERSGFSTY